jgi:hypothetical protein
VKLEGGRGRYAQAAVLNAHAGTLGDPAGPSTRFDNGALVIAETGVFRLAKVTPISGISASKNDPLSLRL